MQIEKADGESAAVSFALLDLTYREHFDGDANCSCEGCQSEFEFLGAPELVRGTGAADVAR